MLDKKPKETDQVNGERKPKGCFAYDLLQYLMDQAADTLSELNIHGTCVEYKCTREHALANRKLLMDHYVDNGGAIHFAKFRDEHKKYCEFVDTCRFGKTCMFALMKSSFENCPLRKMSTHCRNGCKLHGTQNPQPVYTVVINW